MLATDENLNIILNFCYTHAYMIVIPELGSFLRKLFTEHITAYSILVVKVQRYIHIQRRIVGNHRLHFLT